MAAAETDCPPPAAQPKPRALILRNHLSPGDIVMLTAAVRDLHRSYPGRFVTDVRTPCPHLWEHNPYLTSLDENAPGVETIDCEYPLIHRSNTDPWHFIHGFMQFLDQRLGLHIRPTDFKGDLHLAPVERGWMSQVQEITRERVPFWIIVAGGKRDFTIKWWARERFQAVVDHFRGRILFVQAGEASHAHGPLQGVLDLRGKTDLRQLVRLVHHAQGVLCPVTLLMHLAAAVPTAPGAPANRPCVVVAGGREPAQWEAYPHHQFIHTNGALPCCDNGGCWKSRVTPLHDGDEKERPEHLCLDAVPAGPAAPPGEGAGKSAGEGPRNALAYPPEAWPGLLPRCMSLISAAEVARRMELYFEGGVIRYLTAAEADACRATVLGPGWVKPG